MAWSLNTGVQKVARLHHVAARPTDNDFIDTRHTQAERRSLSSHCAHAWYPSPPRNISKCGTAIYQRANAGHIALSVHSRQLCVHCPWVQLRVKVLVYSSATDARACKNAGPTRCFF